MKLVIILGNAAVGKMTVGQELTEITDLCLFHNHMSIEPVVEVFGYFNGNAVAKIRTIIFDEFLSSDLYGLIFTYMMDFSCPDEWRYIDDLTRKFKEKGSEVYYVELVASKEIRMERNVTDNRLLHKASKRDIEVSNQRLLRDDLRYRCVSNDGEVTWDNYIKIDNTNLTPQAVAMEIKGQFGL